MDDTTTRTRERSSSPRPGRRRSRYLSGLLAAIVLQAAIVPATRLVTVPLEVGRA